MENGMEWLSGNPCDVQTVMELLSPYAKPETTDTVLADIGCGDGETLAWLSAHTPYQLHGVEPEPSRLEAAKIACPGVVFMGASAENLPYADGFLDLALMECVFSLILEPEKAASELARTMKRDGVVLLADLYAQAGEDAYIDECDCLGHIYARQSIEYFFTKNGFILLAFHDRSGDLRASVAQGIMSGKGMDGIDKDSLSRLRQVKAGYGIWLWKKAG